MSHRIVIDQREQHPLIPIRYKSGKPVEVSHVFGTLKTGDYSVEGLENVVCIERKGSDLWSTLYGSAELANGDTRSHLERFREELERMQPMERRWWLYEGSIHDFEAYAENRRLRWKNAGSRGRPPPDFHAAHSLICAIASDYNIPIIWAGSRQNAAHFIGCTLGRIAEQASDFRAADKSRERGLCLPWAMAETEVKP